MRFRVLAVSWRCHRRTDLLSGSLVASVATATIEGKFHLLRGHRASPNDDVERFTHTGDARCDKCQADLGLQRWRISATRYHTDFAASDLHGVAVSGRTGALEQ